jgi:uncharacterized Zn finger protein
MPAWVTLTRHTEAEVLALVNNGTGKEYGVTLTQAGAFCSCPDALYRGVTCKHSVALALHVIRNPYSEREHKPNLKLARVREGFCG